MRKIFKSKLYDVLLEFFIVLISISVAFYVDDWSKRRSDRELERQYLEDLHSDIEKDLVELKDVGSFSRAIYLKFREVIRFYSGEETTFTQDSVDVYADMIGNHSFFYPTDFTHRVLEQTGDFKLIRNKELKKGLIRLHKAYEGLENSQTNFLQGLDDNYFPYLYENYDLIEGKPTIRNYFQQGFVKNYVLYAMIEQRNLSRMCTEAQTIANEVRQLIEREIN